MLCNMEKLQLGAKPDVQCLIFVLLNYKFFINIYSIYFFSFGMISYMLLYSKFSCFKSLSTCLGNDVII